MSEQTKSYWRFKTYHRDQSSTEQLKTLKRFGQNRRKNTRGPMVEAYPERLVHFWRLGVTRQLYRRATDLMGKYGSMMLQDLDYETARDGLLRVARLAPNQSKCHNNLAVLYWEHGKYEQAVCHFRKALDLDPDDRETVWNCGQVMTIVGETLIARHTYVSFMNRNGYDEEMASAIAHL